MVKMYLKAKVMAAVCGCARPVSLDPTAPPFAHTMSTLADSFLDDLDELDDEEEVHDGQSSGDDNGDDGSDDSGADSDGLDLDAMGDATDVLGSANSRSVTSVATLRASAHFREHMKVGAALGCACGRRLARANSGVLCAVCVMVCSVVGD